VDFNKYPEAVFSILKPKDVVAYKTLHLCEAALQPVVRWSVSRLVMVDCIRNEAIMYPCTYQLQENKYCALLAH
jgi:hypothetical protein